MPSCTALLRVRDSSFASSAISENAPRTGRPFGALGMSADGGASHRNRHHEHGAARLIRLDAHAAVVTVDQPLDDRKPEAGAACLARAARIHLIKGVEHPTALGFGDADTG